MAPIFQRFLMVLVLWALAGCSGRRGEGGAPPSLFKPFVAHPGGSVIYYRDDEARHRITLFEGGRYRFETKGHMGDELLARREGYWKWKSSGKRDVQLTLDHDRWKLKFVSPESAVAVNQAAGGRTFAFHFERM